MSAQQQSPTKPINKFLNDFPWIHLGIGLIGNAGFVAGSICFFYSNLETTALWLFTIGSVGMFFGSLGELFVKLEERGNKESEA